MLFGNKKAGRLFRWLCTRSLLGSVTILALSWINYFHRTPGSQELSVCGRESCGQHQPNLSVIIYLNWQLTKPSILLIYPHQSKAGRSCLIRVSPCVFPAIWLENTSKNTRYCRVFYKSKLKASAFG